MSHTRETRSPAPQSVKQTIHSHVFENGLVLVAEPMASVESAAFTFRVPAGTAQEPAEKGGLSAFTCEMAMRGAGKRDSFQLVNDLDNLGVERMEGVSDAHTSYSGATLARNLAPALEIYADVLRRPTMPRPLEEPSRLVCLQELNAVEDEPSQKLIIELRRRHYPDPWGRPSEGAQAPLEAMTADDASAHHAGCYVPNGTILGVAGRFDWSTLKSTVEKLFADWKPGTERRIIEKETGPRRDHIHHESNQTQIGIAYESVAYNDPEYFQAWGAIGVLSGGMSSRLFTEVREKRGLCYSVYASHHSLRDRGSVICYAGTSMERAQETLDVTLGELLRLEKGIEAGELARLKARLKSGLIMQQESSSARSSAIARDWYYLGRPRTLVEIESLVEGVTHETINAFLATHPPRNFTILTLGPAPLETPLGIS